MQIRRMCYSVKCSVLPWSAWCMSSFGSNLIGLLSWSGEKGLRLVQACVSMFACLAGFQHFDSKTTPQLSWTTISGARDRGRHFLWQVLRCGCACLKSPHFAHASNSSLLPFKQIDIQRGFYDFLASFVVEVQKPKFWVQELVEAALRSFDNKWGQSLELCTCGDVARHSKGIVSTAGPPHSARHKHTVDCYFDFQVVVWLRCLDFSSLPFISGPSCRSFPLLPRNNHSNWMLWEWDSQGEEEETEKSNEDKVEWSRLKKDEVHLLDLKEGQKSLKYQSPPVFICRRMDGINQMYFFFDRQRTEEPND